MFLGSTDLLGSDPSPQFWSQIPAGSSTPYSFAVFGDWGDTDGNGKVKRLDKATVAAFQSAQAGC